MNATRQITCRVKGELACFTRPELKVERVSYEVMTPAAARGVLEQILWKPQMYWEVRSIAVLNPIQTTEFRRNEVKKKATLGGRGFNIEDERTQRNTVALKDVDYVITADIGLRERASKTVNLDKYEEMFRRRLELGQVFNHPFLGCREFPADVMPAPKDYKTIDEVGSRYLGYMHYDYDYSYKVPLPLVFRATMVRGVLHIPSWEEVLSFNRASRQ